MLSETGQLAHTGGNLTPRREASTRAFFRVIALAFVFICLCVDYEPSRMPRQLWLSYRERSVYWGQFVFCTYHYQRHNHYCTLFICRVDSTESWIHRQYLSLSELTTEWLGASCVVACVETAYQFPLRETTFTKHLFLHPAEIQLLSLLIHDIATIAVVQRNLSDILPYSATTLHPSM